jgi:hypothetical protein
VNFHSLFSEPAFTNKGRLLLNGGPVSYGFYRMKCSRKHLIESFKYHSYKTTCMNLTRSKFSVGDGANKNHRSDSFSS